MEEKYNFKRGPKGSVIITHEVDGKVYTTTIPEMDWVGIVAGVAYGNNIPQILVSAHLVHDGIPLPQIKVNRKLNHQHNKE